LSFVTVVVASVEAPATLNIPETERLVDEALAKVVWPVTLSVPPTVRRLLIVVDPVIARVLEAGLKVKLVEVPKVFVPCPKSMSLAVKFCNWMVGVEPPLEVMEPAPLTEVTVPAKVVVATIFPF
jgi:hypothetical protein